MPPRLSDIRALWLPIAAEATARFLPGVTVRGGVRADVAVLSPA
jgi:hypothetical protein